MTRLIGADVVTINPEYIALRDLPRNAPLREIIEHLWQQFSPYADPSFRDLFAQDIHQRFWEMYLAVRLLERDIQLVAKPSARGPDVHARIGDSHLWIEAVAPREGTAEDAVPLIEEKPLFEPIPEDKIILRFCNAISEKLAKRQRYVETGLIQAADPFVVAVNGRGIQMTVFDGPFPAIIKAVYPVGPYKVTFNRETLETVSEGYSIRSHITKASGSPVPTNVFLDPLYAGISGVLYSAAALWDMPTEPGSEMLYVHSSVASASLPRGWLCSAKEYYVEAGKLLVTQNPPCA